MGQSDQPIRWKCQATRMIVTGGFWKADHIARLIVHYTGIHFPGRGWKLEFYF